MDKDIYHKLSDIGYV